MSLVLHRFAQHGMRLVLNRFAQHVVIILYRFAGNVTGLHYMIMVWYYMLFAEQSRLHTAINEMMYTTCD